jgi:hypothetical protein
MALIACSCQYDNMLEVVLPDPFCTAHCTCLPEVPDPNCPRCTKENP